MSRKTNCFRMLFMLFSLVIAAQTAETTWKRKNLTSQAWIPVQDVKISKEGDLHFSPDMANSGTSRNFRGAAWLNENVNYSKGLKLNFTPKVKLDDNWFGNQKYPEGFAFVFTPAQAKDTVGEDMSGIGFSGIKKGVVIEFDFISSKDKKDPSYAHISVFADKDGKISNIHGTDLKTVRMNNFFDESKKDFVPEHMELTLIGGKLTLKAGDHFYFNQVKMPIFDEFFDQEHLSFGVTSSMNMFKAVSIADISMFEVDESKIESILSVREPEASRKAGEGIEFELQNSIFSQNLRVYEYEVSQLSVFIGETQYREVKYSFDEDKYVLVIKLESVKKAGDLVFGFNMGKSRIGDVTVQFYPSNETRYDICSDSVDAPYKDNMLTKIGKTYEKVYEFKICSYDLYKNPKQGVISSRTELFELKYPKDIIPENASITYTPSLNRLEYKISVPLSIGGEYYMYNNNFLGDKRRYFKVEHEKVSRFRSFAVRRDRFAPVGEEIYFDFHLFSEYNNKIDFQTFTNSGCAFNLTKLSYENLKASEDLVIDQILPSAEDYSLSLKYKRGKEGKYSFDPTLSCDGKAVAIECFECEFYFSSNTFSLEDLLVSNPFTQTTSLASKTELTINSEENEQSMLSEIFFVDTASKAVKLSEVPAEYEVEKTTATLINSAEESAELVPRFNPEGGIELHLPFNRQNMRFGNFKIELIVSNKKFTVNGKFVFTDKLFSLGTFSASALTPVFLYQPHLSTVESGKDLLLYRIIFLNENKRLVMNSSLYDCSEVKLNVNNENQSIKCEKRGIYLFVRSDMKAGNSQISIEFDNKLGKGSLTKKIHVTAVHHIAKITPVSNNLVTVENNRIKASVKNGPISVFFKIVDPIGNTLNIKEEVVFSEVFGDENVDLELTENGLIRADMLVQDKIGVIYLKDQAVWEIELTDVTTVQQDILKVRAEIVTGTQVTARVFSKSVALGTDIRVYLESEQGTITVFNKGNTGISEGEEYTAFSLPENTQLDGTYQFKAFYMNEIVGVNKSEITVYKKADFGVYLNAIKPIALSESKATLVDPRERLSIKVEGSFEAATISIATDQEDKITLKGVSNIFTVAETERLSYQGLSGEYFLKAGVKKYKLLFNTNPYSEGDLSLANSTVSDSEITISPNKIAFLSLEIRNSDGLIPKDLDSSLVKSSSNLISVQAFERGTSLQVLLLAAGSVPEEFNLTYSTLSFPIKLVSVPSLIPSTFEYLSYYRTVDSNVVRIKSNSRFSPDFPISALFSAKHNDKLVNIVDSAYDSQTSTIQLVFKRRHTNLKITNVLDSSNSFEAKIPEESSVDWENSFLKLNTSRSTVSISLHMFNKDGNPLPETPFSLIQAHFYRKELDNWTFLKNENIAVSNSAASTSLAESGQFKAVIFTEEHQINCLNCYFELEDRNEFNLGQTKLETTAAILSAGEGTFLSSQSPPFFSFLFFDMNGNHVKRVPMSIKATLTIGKTESELEVYRSASRLVVGPHYARKTVRMNGKDLGIDQQGITEVTKQWKEIESTVAGVRLEIGNEVQNFSNLIVYGENEYPCRDAKFDFVYVSKDELQVDFVYSDCDNPGLNAIEFETVNAKGEQVEVETDLVFIGDRYVLTLTGGDNLNDGLILKAKSREAQTLIKEVLLKEKIEAELNYKFKLQNYSKETEYLTFEVETFRGEERVSAYLDELDFTIYLEGKEVYYKTLPQEDGSYLVSLMRKEAGVYTIKKEGQEDESFEVMRGGFEQVDLRLVHEDTIKLEGSLSEEDLNNLEATVYCYNAILGTVQSDSVTYVDADSDDNFITLNHSKRAECSALLYSFRIFGVQVPVQNSSVKQTSKFFSAVDRQSNLSLRAVALKGEGLLAFSSEDSAVTVDNADGSNSTGLVKAKLGKVNTYYLAPENSLPDGELKLKLNAETIPVYSYTNLSTGAITSFLEISKVTDYDSLKPATVVVQTTSQGAVTNLVNGITATGSSGPASVKVEPLYGNGLIRLYVSPKSSLLDEDISFHENGELLNLKLRVRSVQNVFDTAKLISTEILSGEWVRFEFEFSLQNNPVCNSRLSSNPLQDKHYLIKSIHRFNSKCYLLTHFRGSALFPQSDSSNLALQNKTDILTFLPFLKMHFKVSRGEDKNLNLNFNFKYNTDKFTPIPGFSYKFNENGETLQTKETFITKPLSSFTPGNYDLFTSIAKVHFPAFFFSIPEPEKTVNYHLHVLDQNNKEISLKSSLSDSDYTSPELELPTDLLFQVTNDSKIGLSFPPNSQIAVDLLGRDGTLIKEMAAYKYNAHSFKFHIGHTELEDYSDYPAGDYKYRFKLEVNGKTTEYLYGFNKKSPKMHYSHLNYMYVKQEDYSNLLLKDISGIAVFNKKAYSELTLCLFSGEKVVNEFLDIFFISFTGLEKEAMFISARKRGCFNLSVKKGVLTNNKVITSLGEATLEDAQMSSFGDYKSVKLTKPFGDVELGNTSSVEFELETTEGAPSGLSKTNFSVYVDYKPATEFAAVSKEVSLDLSYKYLKQKVEVVFTDASKNRILLEDLTDKVKVTQTKFDFKKTILSLPFENRAGDDFDFSVLLRDINKDCYTATINLTDFVFEAKLNGADLKIEPEVKNVTDSVCKQLVNVRVTNSKAKGNTGEISVRIKYGDQTTELKKIKVFPNVLSATHSQFSVDGNTNETQIFRVGEEKKVAVLARDAYDNKIPFSEFVLQVGISGLEKEDFSVEKHFEADQIYFKLQLFKAGSFNLNYFYEGQSLLEVKGLKQVKLVPGDCSPAFPSVEVVEDYWYPGEHVQLVVNCKDYYGNPISEDQKANFTMEVSGVTSTVDEDTIPYSFEFKSSSYLFNFLLVYPGSYHANIFLNGEKYGEPKLFHVIDFACGGTERESSGDSAGESSQELKEIMCPNKKCEKRLADCELDVDEKCLAEGKPFKCISEGKLQCVEFNSQCDCEEGLEKVNGFCLKKGFKMQKTLSCILRENTHQCPDGSCRQKDTPCGSETACPIGFKKCGSACIASAEQCTFPACKNHEVLCHDHSCAADFDSCPTIKTCSKEGYKVCPDGRCVKNDHLCSQPPKCEEKYSFICPDFSCRQKEEDCPRGKVCGPGLALCENNECSADCSKSIEKKPVCARNQFTCEDGSCKQNALLCPSIVQCLEGFVKCSNGACAESLQDCMFLERPSKVSCPLENPVLCPDFSCTDSVSKCSANKRCPPHLPYRCGNNECRGAKEDCPTEITCPASFPVLCNDGSCQKGVYHCPNKEEYCTNSVRCSNGLCVTSLSDCPSEVTCPISKIKCTDGSCVTNIQRCSDETGLSCPAEYPKKCSNNQCIPENNLCPHESTCPDQTPVKCEDGTCRESITLCPEVQSCPVVFKTCHNGLCAQGSCPSRTSCSQDHPLLCPGEQRCVKSLEECSALEECFDFRCPDGTCVSNRLFCQVPSSCSSSVPIRCTDGTCKKSTLDCAGEKTVCSNTEVTCPNGECKQTFNQCSDSDCPMDKPFRCKNGECSSDDHFCENYNTGCPFNKPFRCTDGTCVISEAECVELNSTTKCPKGEELCPNGSCNKSSTDCPMMNSCPINKPFKCANGQCVENADIEDTCYQPICPLDKSFRCHDGTCVDSINSCSNQSILNSLNECDKEFPGKNLVMCADGRCVRSFNLCRPLYTCPSKFFKCSDGTCVTDKNYCPQSSNCPKTRPYKCSDGKCVEEQDNCGSLCPRSELFYCPSTNECKRKEEQCDTAQIDKFFGCPKEKPAKCEDGRCMATEIECLTVDPACKVETPFLCNDGTCVKEESECSDKDECPGEQVRCPSNTCIAKKDYWNYCTNAVGCPLSKPVRCIDGSCAAVGRACPAKAACDERTPFLCPDKQCVAAIGDCNLKLPCPLEKSYECPNGICAANELACEDFKDYCPTTAPVKCQSGKCVSSPIKCNHNNTYCAEDEFYCVLKAKCVKRSTDCLPLELLDGSSKRRLNTASTMCEGKIICFDGSCRDSIEQCPISKGCPAGFYRTKLAECSRNYEDFQNDKIECKNNLTLCGDGICRDKCPEYNGCPSTTPFQCVSGKCVEYEQDCIGYSMCNSDTHIHRCATGQCVRSPEECPSINRLFSATDVEATASESEELNLTFSYSNKNEEIGKIYIPANAIDFKKGTVGKVEVKGYPDTKARKIQYSMSSDASFELYRILPHSEGRIGFDTAVMSSIVNLTIPEAEEELSVFGVLTLESLVYVSDSFNKEAYCLARLNAATNLWECQQRKTELYQKEFSIKTQGIYAVIFSPVEKQVTGGSTNYVLEHFFRFLAILGGLVAVFLIIFYAFIRIFRFREKYFEAKEQNDLLKRQIDEMKDTSTDFKGQTLGDNMLNVQYVKNPAYRKKNASYEVTEMETNLEKKKRQNKLLTSQNNQMVEEYSSLNERLIKTKEEIDSMIEEDN